MIFNVNKPLLSLSTVILLVIAGLTGCENNYKFQQARAYKVTDRSQLIGGPKALGNIGDYILENDKIRVLINGHATDMTGGGANRWGGSILDADIQRFEDFFDPTSSGQDMFVGIIPVFDIKFFGLDVFYNSGPVVQVPQDAVKILNDGSDGKAATIRVSGVIHDPISILKLVPVPLNKLPVRAETIYSLAPGDNYVKITTTFTLLEQDGSEPPVVFDVPMRTITPDDNPVLSMFPAGVFGDAVFYGNSLDVIGPGVFGFSSSFYVEKLYKSGRSILSYPVLLQWSAGVSDAVGYALVSPEGPMSFPLMEDFLTVAFQKIADSGGTIPGPGSSFTFTRYLVVDDGDVAGLLDHVIGLKGLHSGKLVGNVLDESTGRAVSGARVFVFPHPRFKDGSLVPVARTYEEMNAYLSALPEGEVDYFRLMPYSRFTTDSRRFDKDKDGSFEGCLPVDPVTGTANYILMASGPGKNRSQLVPIKIVKGETKKTTLILPGTGSLDLNVYSLSQDGPSEPCKVTIISQDGKGLPDPFLGESFLPAKEAMVLHLLDGRGKATLPAGTYRVVASRGPEYSSDEKIIKLEPMETRRVDLYIDRVVDTSGWVAADLHMHTETSPDSSVSIEDRILSALAHGLDIIAGTDHDYITNYFPAWYALSGSDRIAVLLGEELSHFSYGHFNAYPLRYDQKKTAGGAVQWRNPSPSTTLPDGSVMPEYVPKDCFDSLRELGDRNIISQDPIVIVNHSQESFTGYLRAFGFQQYYGTFGTPDILTIGNPVVHNGRLFSKDGSANFSWDFDGIELLNAKRFHDFRTCTEEEVNDGKIGQPQPPDTPYLPTLIRTADEQARILTGDLLLDSTNRGMIDDYMTLLAIGKYVAGLGASDSHTLAREEVGKCRTYVMSSTDDPRFLDANEFITNLKAGRAIATTGPFLELWVNGQPIGSDVYDIDGTLHVRVKAQAPEWMSLDRIEIYANGVLIGEIGRDSSGAYLGCDTHGIEIAGRDKVVRLDKTFSCRINRDAFIMAIAIGYEGMTPQSNPIDGPVVGTEEALILGVNQFIEQWLGISNLIPISGTIERKHEVYPFAVTNAIFVDMDGIDADGDGRGYDGPRSIPGWFKKKDMEEAGSDEALGMAVLAAKTKMLSLTRSILTTQSY